MARASAIWVVAASADSPPFAIFTVKHEAESWRARYMPAWGLFRIAVNPSGAAPWGARKAQK